MADPISIPVTEDKSWQDMANCLGVDPDLFFPERGASTREAKEVCRGCVVREDCLEYALANGEKFGIWGGMSERERRRIRRQRALARAAAARPAAPPPPDPPHAAVPVRPPGLSSRRSRAVGATVASASRPSIVRSAARSSSAHRSGGTASSTAPAPARPARPGRSAPRRRPGPTRRPARPGRGSTRFIDTCTSVADLRGRGPAPRGRCGSPTRCAGPRPRSGVGQPQVVGDQQPAGPHRRGPGRRVRRRRARCRAPRSVKAPRRTSGSDALGPVEEARHAELVAGPRRERRRGRRWRTLDRWRRRGGRTAPRRAPRCGGGRRRGGGGRAARPPPAATARGASSPTRVSTERLWSGSVCTSSRSAPAAAASASMTSASRPSLMLTTHSSTDAILPHRSRGAADGAGSWGGDLVAPGEPGDQALR